MLVFKRPKNGIRITEMQKSDFIQLICWLHLVDFETYHFVSESEGVEPALPLLCNCKNLMNSPNAKPTTQSREPSTSTRARVWSSTTTSTNRTAKPRLWANTVNPTKWNWLNCWKTPDWWLEWKSTNSKTRSIGSMSKAQVLPED